VLPWLMRTTLSMLLYETYVYINFFNMTSPKFDEGGGTNRETCLHFTATSLHRKKKRISPTKTLDIC
jgi:hypothetical protein